MNKLYKGFFALLLAVLCFSSCSNINGNSNSYPMLKVINNYSERIVSVSLVGYSFESLYIGNGQSQTFYLTNGMPAGYRNINVRVWDGMHVALNYTCNFADGEVTVLNVHQ